MTFLLIVPNYFKSYTASIILVVNSTCNMVMHVSATDNLR